MNIRNIKNFAITSVASVTIMACSTEVMSELDRTKADFTKDLNGNISPMQWWHTAVKLNINITTGEKTQLWLMSDKDKGTLFDYKEAETSGTIQMIAPQGCGNTMYIVSVCNRQKDIQEVILTGKAEENININIELKDTNDGEFSTHANVTTTGNKTKANTPMRMATSLYGSSIAGNAKHNELTTEQIEDALSLIERAYKEHIPAKSLGANCDYELKSNGDFNVTWFAGNSMSVSPHVFGYYYHTPGTYEDIKYVDLSETEVYDYIDGLAKVQYKVNDAAAKQYGVLTDHWYDANFDMGDTFDKQAPYISARRDDDAYNSIDVLTRYGHNITNLRGVSFTINVPEGMYVGFYDRVESIAQPEQYDRFVKMGIKPYTTRDNFKAMNFSCEAMNMNINGSYRSSVFKTSHALWLGMENDYTGGDLDCNDVMFEVAADLEIHHPTVVEPDLKPFGEYDNLMPWTIAFEDVARDADFDFNDAVVKITPDYENEMCAVTIMAAGSTSRMYLHYDGPNGDENLGEIHELLGRTTGIKINTTTSIPQTPFAEIGNVKWLKKYTMENDAQRFYIEVKRGTCTDCSDVISLAQEPGQMPEALLVAGEWKWPMEGINITKAYDTFADWSKDITRVDYWNWYLSPKSSTCVSY